MNTGENPAAGYKHVPTEQERKFKDPDEVCYNYFYNIVRAIHRVDTDLVDLSTMVLNSGSCDHITNFSVVRFGLKEALVGDYHDKIRTTLKECHAGSESYANLLKFWKENADQMKDLARSNLPICSKVQSYILYPSKGVIESAEQMHDQVLWREKMAREEVRWGACGRVVCD